MGQINRQLHWILSFGNLVISICGTPGLIENFENKITVSLNMYDHVNVSTTKCNS